MIGRTGIVVLALFVAVLTGCNPCGSGPVATCDIPDRAFNDVFEGEELDCGSACLTVEVAVGSSTVDMLYVDEDGNVLMLSWARADPSP